MTAAPATPRVRFVIGGVQKGGTTAMAHCLAQHPDVVLPFNKEAHVFDAPDFEDDATAHEVDSRFAAYFPAGRHAGLHGDATPIYCLHERFVERIARYNPAMKWVLLLRDPAERAISQYFMERLRGDEDWSLLTALLFERWRLRGHRNDFSSNSPLRRHSYRLRGDYARQLDALYRHFPRDQVLVLRSRDFRQASGPTLERVYRHLGLEGPVRLPDQTQVFEGHYAQPSRFNRVVARALLWTASRDLLRRHGINLK